MSKKDLFDEFNSPSDEFSPFPFWFWNDDLSEGEIKRQISEFHRKGVDGFVIHPRIGLPQSIPYMSDSWLYFVEFATKQAKSLGMRVILYDEGMYPSGSCHGEVVRVNPEYASKCLEMRENDPYNNGDKLIAEIKRDGKNYYFFESFSGGTIRGIHFGEDDGQPGAPKSADLLNFDAVKCFIKLTHERYYSRLKEYFGNTIIGIFTDEPMICGRGPQKIPWTSGLLDDLKRNDFSLSDLYYLFSDDGTEKSKSVKKLYDSIVRNRLQKSFYDQISKWCGSHNVSFIGHPEKSTDIALLKHFDIPCQDIVWRYVAPGDDNAIKGPHSTMAKCASDSARHRGKRRNGNECFGCCGHTDDPYAFTFEDMKWYIDWLFVRGCNLLIPHAFFYSIRGKRKEERPPDVGMNSSFWNDYKCISDYIKRCCAINTDSVNVTDIAILCGDDDLPWRAAKILYESQIEFNYLEYSLLKECSISEGRCGIGANSYKILIVDGVYSDKEYPYLSLFKETGGILLDYETCSDFIGHILESSRTTVDLVENKDLRISHIRKYNTDILFCVNEGEAPISTLIKERVTEVLDAESGNIISHSGDEYLLTLKPRQSLHLIVEQKSLRSSWRKYDYRSSYFEL